MPNSAAQHASKPANLPLAVLSGDLSDAPESPRPVTLDTPRVGLHRLDQLWFQLTGTICNLACTHCFISCSPTNDSFEFLPTEKVMTALDEAPKHGTREVYFTGGEPFLHPDVLPILRRALEIGPATVLTNGTLLHRKDTVEQLAAVRDGSIYSLEIRVSIDGPDADSNDAIRGKHSFDRAMRGVKLLVDAGFLPIITMAQTWDDADAEAVYERMKSALNAVGYDRPRVKLLPSLKIGQEALRDRGYDADEVVTKDMMTPEIASAMLCSHSRILTTKGWHVCPILIEQPDSVLGDDLETATASKYPLRHSACFTCWLSGAICSNASASASFKEQHK